MSRENNLNAIRFIATIMVIAGHMGILSGNNGSTPIIFGQVIHAIGVKIIFIISGYLIASSWMADPDVIRYAIKRFFRLWPPLATCIIVSVIVVGPIFSELSVKEYLNSSMTWDYLKNVVFAIKFNLPGLFVNNPYPNAVNGSLWTLPIEVLLYIFIPIFLRCIEKLKQKDYIKIILSVCICSLSILQQKFFPNWSLKIAWVYITPTALTLIGYYTIGMVFTIPRLKKLLNLTLATMIVLIYKCFAVGWLKNEAVLFIILPYLILSWAFAPSGKLMKILSKIECTYSLYLYGFIVQQIVIYILMVRISTNLGYNTLLIICILITYGIALFSYWLVEKPMQVLSKRIISRYREITNKH